MSDLPLVTLPNGSFTEGPLKGVEYHSLSRSQAMKLQSFQGREDEAEDFLISCALDMSVDAAHAWRDSVHLSVAGELVDAIITISGLGNGST